MAENNPAMMMMTAVLGQTVRLLPIIGEADKEATYPGARIRFWPLSAKQMSF